MFPYLDEAHQIPTYGVLFSIGIIASIIVSVFMMKKSNISKEDMIYASSYALIGGITGSKALFLLVSADFIIQNHIPLIDAMKSGFVFYGGLLGGALGYFIYGRLYKINVIDMYDRAVCSLPLGQFFGRLGCFSAGCCYGRPTDCFLGVIYVSPVDPNTPVGIKILPTQLFEAFFCLTLFVVIQIADRKELKRGTKMLIYIFSYGTFRFINEYFRYDSIRGSIGALSTSQIISLLLILFGIGYLVLQKLIEKRHIEV